MDVIVDSSFGIGMATFVRDRTGVSVQDKTVPAAALFLADESGGGGSQIGLASRIGLRMNRKSPEESSEDSSSSIGECSENEEEEEGVAVSFQKRGGGGGTLCSFGSSLEDSLPIKRGLSNHYVGKSKSFRNLMEPMNFNAKDLEKRENPFNKRRRLLIANKLRSRERSMSVSNFYSWQNPNSMSLLAVQEQNEVNHHNDDYEENEGDDQTIMLLEKRNMLMKNKKDLIAQTQSCFCLSSLQEDDDDDDDDEGGVDNE